MELRIGSHIAKRRFDLRPMWINPPVDEEQNSNRGADHPANEAAWGAIGSK